MAMTISIMSFGKLFSLMEHWNWRWHWRDIKTLLINHYELNQHAKLDICNSVIKCGSQNFRPSVFGWKIRSRKNLKVIISLFFSPVDFVFDGGTEFEKYEFSVLLSSLPFSASILICIYFSLDDKTVTNHTLDYDG